jgi:hypothetical protein
MFEFCFDDRLYDASLVAHLSSVCPSAHISLPGTMPLKFIRICRGLLSNAFHRFPPHCD